MRPPWTRWRATHPQRWTLFPTSSADNSPQSSVRETHLRRDGGRGGGGFTTESMEVAAAVELEKALRVRGSGFLSLGKRKRTAALAVAERKREGRRGRVRRRRDIAGRSS